MVSELTPSMDCDANVVAEQPVAGSLLNKKNQGKVPKKIHKAEREKLKRDQLNELFLELGDALEPPRQNNGKASILGDATRILRDLILQVESLRKESVALVKESHYLATEKNELKDENITLEAEIARLHNELRERLQSDPMWHDSSTDQALPAPPTSTAVPLPQPPVAPLYMVPFHQGPQTLPEAATAPKPETQVTRPHARYPTPSDSWPMQILSRHRHSGSSCSSSGDEGSDRS